MVPDTQLLSSSTRLGLCLVEKWLKGGEGVVFDDYGCFGHNRASVSRKAVIGSGGVRLLVKKLILGDWSVEVVDIRLEDVILVKLERKETQSLLQFATFLAGSSWDIDPEGALMF